MIRHIVMWTLHAHALGCDKATNAAKAQRLLLKCARTMPGVRHIEVATAQAGMECTSDLLLNMVFDDAQALAAYQNHPDHLALKPFMNAVVFERRCMDFTMALTETSHGTHSSTTL